MCTIVCQPASIRNEVVETAEGMLLDMCDFCLGIFSTFLGNFLRTS